MITSEEIKRRLWDGADYYDSFIRTIEKISENEYLVGGNIKIKEINRLLDVHMESDDYDTNAGFVIGLINRFPNLRFPFISNFFHITTRDISFFVSEFYTK